MSQPRARILFVEDEPSISGPFSKALVRAGFEPLVAATGSAALSLAERLPPDLVLLDLNLPDADGLDVCRELRQRADTPIVMLTARGTETDRIVGLDLGADDYVVKPFSADEVIARIRAVLRRARPAETSEPIVVGQLRLEPDTRRATLAGEPIDLSRKEFDLLGELARNAGRVVSREDLMTRVWDENWFGPTKTLDTHIGWLRRKLGEPASAPRYIHTVYGVGFLLSAPEELGP